MCLKEVFYVPQSFIYLIKNILSFDVAGYAEMAEMSNTVNGNHCKILIVQTE